jgi:pimeloyl-ACP methyl ester carboxylesterase
MNSRKPRFLRVILIALLLVPGLSIAGPPPYYVDESLLPFAPLPGATAYWGVHTGAGYRIEVPDDWNGELVMWAHGFRGLGPELRVQNPPIREYLIAQGYAWAASSYRRNDYDVANGVQDTHALMKRFNGIVAKPSKVYIMGASMGGHITAVAIEQYPKAFAGALPVCGVLADFEQFDYFLDFNVAAQQLALGSSMYPVDFVSYVTTVVPAIKAGLEAVPGGWPLALNDAGMKHKNLVELRSGGDRPNFDEAWFFWNVFAGFASGPGNFFFDLSALFPTLARSPGQINDNIGVVYQFDTDPSLSPEEIAFNNDVFRIMADPQARSPNGLAQVPVISGDINIPVLTIHNLGDLFVPVLHEIEYARRVAGHGKSDFLVQRAVRGAGHCNVTPNEFVSAFADLVNWVETGAKPPGDNWLDPAAVADPAFGCTFTDGFHFFAEPCP